MTQPPSPDQPPDTPAPDVSDIDRTHELIAGNHLVDTLVRLALRGFNTPGIPTTRAQTGASEDECTP